VNAAVLAMALVLALGQEPAPTEPTPLQRFEQGVEAYRRGDPESAAHLWQRLVAEGHAELDSAVLCYDLGNAAFRSGRPLEAAAWYSASLRMEPRSADAWSNLELAREKAGLEPADRGDLVDTLRRLATAQTLAELEWTLVVLAGLLLASLLLEAVLGGASLRRTAWSLAALLVVVAALWTWRVTQDRGPQLFVVESGGTTIHSEPRADAAAVGRAEPAELLEPTDALPGWRRVRSRSGARGWVREAEVLELPTPGASS